MSRVDPSVATMVLGPCLGSMFVIALFSRAPSVNTRKMSLTDLAVIRDGRKGFHSSSSLFAGLGVMSESPAGFHFGGRVSIKSLASQIQSEGDSQPVFWMVMHVVQLRYQNSQWLFVSLRFARSSASPMVNILCFLRRHLLDWCVARCQILLLAWVWCHVGSCLAVSFVVVWTFIHRPYFFAKSVMFFYFCWILVICVASSIGLPGL